MSFISNIFLWLLPLTSIPLIIHLLNRRKIIRIDFSSIYFLETLKKNSMKRINILQWLLLFMRTLIILMIILMMSRPILQGYYPEISIDPSSSLSIVVIDDSFSMNGGNSNESRIEIINKKYNQILDSFDEKTQICIISLSNGILYEGIKSNLLDLSKTISISNQKGDLYKYVNIINKKFDSSIINKEVFIITDGQSNLLKNVLEEDVKDWTIFFILLNKLNYNLKINHAKIDNEIIVKDKKNDIKVEIENNGFNDISNKIVNIFVNEVNVGFQSVDVKSGEKINISFSTVFTEHGNNIVEVRLSEDDNDSDNNYYINIYIPDEINILSIFNKIGNIKYISNAIDVINKKNNIFKHDMVHFLDLSYGDLDKYDVIVIYDYEIIEFHYNYFEELFNTDSHLIIMPDEDNNYQQLYGILNSDYDGRYISLDKDIYEKISYLDFISKSEMQSNIESKDFIKVFKYIEGPLNSSSMTSLGNLNSFWDRIYFEKSKLDLFFSSLHLDWNEFPLKGYFIQFMKELFYANYDNYYNNYYIEEEILLKANSENDIENLEHKDPYGDISYRMIETDAVYIRSITIPGIHEFYNAEELLYLIAVNIHPEELLSNILPSEEINKLLGGKCYFLNLEKDSISKSIIKARQGYEVWRYVLWTLCLLIVVEMLISNAYRKT